MYPQHWRKWVCLPIWGVMWRELISTYFQVPCMSICGFLPHSEMFFSFCYIPEVSKLDSQKHHSFYWFLCAVIDILDHVFLCIREPERCYLLVGYNLSDHNHPRCLAIWFTALALLVRSHNSHNWAMNVGLNTVICVSSKELIFTYWALTMWKTAWHGQWTHYWTRYLTTFSFI